MTTQPAHHHTPDTLLDTRRVILIVEDAHDWMTEFKPPINPELQARFRADSRYSGLSMGRRRSLVLTDLDPALIPSLIAAFEHAQPRESKRFRIRLTAEAQDVFDAMSRPLTVLDVAVARGAQRDEQGYISGGEFERLGLPLIGGCAACGATVAAYNACPSVLGYLLCASGCVGHHGFYTMAEYERWERAQDEWEQARAEMADLGDRDAGDDTPEFSNYQE